jgi:hypothetical protein
VIGLLIVGLRKGWVLSGGEWNQIGTNVTLTQIDFVVKAEESENPRTEEAGRLRDDIRAHFGTNLIPIAKLDEYLDTESNVLKAVELKT